MCATTPRRRKRARNVARTYRSGSGFKPKRLVGQRGLGHGCTERKDALLAKGGSFEVFERAAADSAEPSWVIWPDKGWPFTDSGFGSSG